MFEGLGTAIITPFKKGKLDLESLNKLLKYQVDNGVNFIVACGSTGEATTLSDEEQSQVISTAVKYCKEKGIKVVAGATSSNTEEALRMAKRNKDLGCDGLLISVPPYNKPTMEGLFQHYKLIAETVKLPIVIYNVPGRAAKDINNDTIARLSQLDYIIALKDATGDLSRVADLKLKTKKGFTQLSGEDATAVGFNAMGGRGVISVSGNIAPKLCSELQKATLSGDFAKALEYQDKLTKLHQIMFCETNPIPVKYACSLLGFGDGSVRLPLTEAEEGSKEKIKKVMKELELI